MELMKQSVVTSEQTCSEHGRAQGYPSGGGGQSFIAVHPLRIISMCGADFAASIPLLR